MEIVGYVTVGYLIIGALVATVGMFEYKPGSDESRLEVFIFFTLNWPFIGGK